MSQQLSYLNTFIMSEQVTKVYYFQVGIYVFVLKRLAKCLTTKFLILISTVLITVCFKRSHRKWKGLRKAAKKVLVVQWTKIK